MVRSGDPVVLHWSRHVTGTWLTKFWSNCLGQLEASNRGEEMDAVISGLKLKESVAGSIADGTCYKTLTDGKRK